MIELQKSYILRFSYTIHFVSDEKIRLKQAQAEKFFGDLSALPSKNLNIPDEAPGEIPRIVFDDSKRQRQIVMSQKSIQLGVSFAPFTHGALLSQIELLQGLCKEFDSAVEEFIGTKQLTESTLVFGILCPDGRSVGDLVTLFNKKFFNLPEIGKVASAAFKVGYEYDDVYFMNISGDVYYSSKPSTTLRIIGSEASDASIVETGLQFNIDINNKRSQIATGQFVYKGSAPAFAVFRSFYETQFEVRFLSI